MSAMTASYPLTSKDGRHPSRSHTTGTRVRLARSAHASARVVGEATDGGAEASSVKIG
jgi:hypothetical protein